MKLRACPLLVQSDTSRSWTVEGESHTRTYFLRCLGEECAAFAGGNCERFGTVAKMPERLIQKIIEQEGDHGEV